MGYNTSIPQYTLEHAHFQQDLGGKIQKDYFKYLSTISCCVSDNRKNLCVGRERKDRKNIIPSSVKWFHYRFFIIVSSSGTSFEIIRIKSGIKSLIYFINVSLINWNCNCSNIDLTKLDEWTKLAFESEHDSVQTRNRRDLKFGSKGEVQRWLNHW